ncbi:MAG: GNAT family N-acetyltransferase [Ignavibacteria bacterium]|nr:GNAT family N-acetyltransferase [Ignavibacteria bacterium]
MSVTLRPAYEADNEFLWRLYASTREEELAIVPWSKEQKEEFTRMQFTAQTQFYTDVYPEMEYSIIVNDGVDAGRLIVARLKDEIRVIDIALLPAHRGFGIGKALLEDLIAEAEEMNKPVRLHVEHFNRARNLYDRMGFKPVADRGVHVMMEWNPETTMKIANHELSDARS